MLSEVQCPTNEVEWIKFNSCSNQMKSSIINVVSMWRQVLGARYRLHKRSSKCQYVCVVKLCESAISSEQSNSPNN